MGIHSFERRAAAPTRAEKAMPSQERAAANISQAEHGPARQGDMSVETRGLLPVPHEERHGPVWRIFTVWFSANMVPPTFFVGTLAGADFVGLGFQSGLLAILLGNV